MKKEWDWSVSYTIGWGGVNQCPKWGEQALLLMWHICQLMAVALKNEGLPFIFFAGRTEVHPSICLFLQPLTILFYLLLSSVVVINVFLFFLFYSLSSLFFFWVCPKQTLILLSGVHTYVFLSFFLSLLFFFFFTSATLRVGFSIFPVGLGCLCWVCCYNSMYTSMCMRASAVLCPGHWGLPKQKDNHRAFFPQSPSPSPLPGLNSHANA